MYAVTPGSANGRSNRQRLPWWRRWRAILYELRTYRWRQVRWWSSFVFGPAALRRWVESLAWVGRDPKSEGRSARAVPPPVTVAAGAIHVHTTYSDGSGSVPEVAAQA